MRTAIVDDIASERENLNGRMAAQADRLSHDGQVYCKRTLPNSHLESVPEVQNIKIRCRTKRIIKYYSVLCVANL